MESSKIKVEKTLSAIAFRDVKVTLYSVRDKIALYTIAWDGEDKNIFKRLQRFFKGRLFDYEYDKECDLSICSIRLEVNKQKSVELD